MVFGRWLTSGNRVNLCYELVALVVGHRERKGKTSPGLADDDALEAAKLLKINDNTVTQISDNRSLETQTLGRDIERNALVLVAWSHHVPARDLDSDTSVTPPVRLHPSTSKLPKHRLHLVVRPHNHRLHLLKSD